MQTDLHAYASLVVDAYFYGLHQWLSSYAWAAERTLRRAELSGPPRGGPVQIRFVWRNGLLRRATPTAYPWICINTPNSLNMVHSLVTTPPSMTQWVMPHRFTSRPVGSP